MTRQIFWPVLGVLLGFASFYVVLVCGVSIPSEHLPDKLVELASIAIATLIAAWAGGWAAFKAERETQESNRRAERISAANKAIFTIAMAYTAYENLRQHAIDKDGVRNDPDRALKMDSPQAGMMRKIQFNFDELSFLLDQQGELSSMVLMELMLFEWQYQVLLQTVESRAQVFEELHIAIQANPIGNHSPAAIKTRFAAQYTKLDALTDQLIEIVDTGLISSKDINIKVQSALQQQFLGQSFLQINFQQAPAAQ